MLRLEGRPVADEVYISLAQETARLKAQKGIAPLLAVILVGDLTASRLYVGSKEKAAARTGIATAIYRFDTAVTEQELLAQINELNKERTVHGIMCQLPLPAHIRADIITAAIDPDKDVDGLSPLNQGRLVLKQTDKGFIPCTPQGILYLLHHYNIPIGGKKAVVVGRSGIVGLPVAQLLLQENATVTLCHSKTADLEAEIKNADIVVAAAGQSRLIKSAWLKKGAVAVDVGINRVADSSEKGYKITGDIETPQLSEAYAYTPVPGGVGLLTVAMLMKNVVRSAVLKL
jgi:methylenetetrahydrofolate dehydrogenase (NADP+)/methenyltetrahydrofolate cyclohydrolase